MASTLLPPHPFAGLGHHRYGVILADPPWRFRTWSETNQHRTASKHYSLMTLDEIACLPICDLAAPSCALFLWVINPMLPHALSVIERWGFKFKTVAFTWAKTSPTTQKTWAPKYHVGLGYWTRANTEMCLLAVRGTPKRIAKDVRQLIVAPRRQHSRKPDEIYSSVSRLLAGPYLDLFSREHREGWDSFGFESGKFNEAA